MRLVNTRLLKEDVLFRASEPLTGSAWNSKTVDYLNRVYGTLAAGASEFLPEYIEDWWWMRLQGVLNLEPTYRTGTVQVTKGSTAITFSPAPSMSLQGRRLKVQGHPDLSIIETHTAGITTAALDEPYTGPSATTSFDAMKVVYTLDAAVECLISPIIGFRDSNRISGMPPEQMDDLFPLRTLEPGEPVAFTLENDTTVRFSHGGRVDGLQMRVEYRYRPILDELEDSVDSIPVIPIKWRHLLSDMALVYVFLDKNDDRSNATALAARTGLAAMLKENRRKNIKIDKYVGHIFPRAAGQPNTRDNLRQTSSGVTFDF